VAAIKLYVTIDRSWRSAGALRTRLRSIIALPRNADPPSSTRSGETEQAVSVAMDATIPLIEPDLATARILVAERWDICTCGERELHTSHTVDCVVKQMYGKCGDTGWHNYCTCRALSSAASIEGHWKIFSPSLPGQ